MGLKGVLIWRCDSLFSFSPSIKKKELDTQFKVDRVRPDSIPSHRTNGARENVKDNSSIGWR